jgi:cytochrome b pre-mRNA-processing protein 3
MILGLFGRKSAPVGEALYRAIVAQARHPALYIDHRVPDTVEGRFEMIVLHLVLVFNRLKTGTRDEVALGQGALDLFFTEVDHQMRQMGVGDLTVPKKMKKVGEAWTGRSRAYDAVLDQADVKPIAEALGRNIPGEDVATDRMATYVLTARAALAASPSAAVANGTFTWPDPASVAESDAV